MKIAIILLAAYLLTGAFCVWRDLSERNYARMTIYIVKYRSTGDRWALLTGALAWLPGGLLNAYYRRRVFGASREAMALGIFIALAVFFWMISN
jgi:hypothetical protein